MKKLFLWGGVYVYPVYLVSQYCIPTSDCSWNDYIDGFQFNTISNMNSGCSTGGYGNYTSISTTVVSGSSYALTIYNNPYYDEYFGVWIDFNANGSFNDPGEFVYNGYAPAGGTLSGNITIPSNATPGATRLRVRCQYGAALNAGDACLNISWGETEDYTVVIQPPFPPVAGFSAVDTTCNGTVVFVDQSLYATSWNWDFGDGTTSSAQNPTHTYSAYGVYTVTQIVCNNIGCDTTQTTIHYIQAPAMQPSCVPQTQNYCCGFGITEFQFATIHNFSADGSAGYEDFTCMTATVYAGRYYPLFIRTDQPAPHNVKVWIDYNNDGAFSSAELVFSRNQVLMIQDSIYINPASAYNTPVRMRVWADYYLQPAGTACTGPQNGQVEDYSLIILPNPYPPVANFSTTDTVSCDGVVHFHDHSYNTPTAWVWDFGDGTTSSQQNPVHIYTASGIYDVMLMVYNNNGGDTLIKPSYVTVNLGGGPAAPSCKPQTQSYCCDYGIYGVTINTLQMNTGGGWEGYMDFSCKYTDTLYLGTPYTITIFTGNTNNSDIQVWLDGNNNGTFEPAELVFTSTGKKYHTGTILFYNVPAGIGVPLRLRIVADYEGASLSACYSPLWGQVEDYAVVFTSPPVPPVAFFTVDSIASCPGQVQFINNSQYGISFLWDFGDGTTSSDHSPVHSYSPGVYVVTLVASNPYGTSTHIDTVLIHPGFCNHIPLPPNDTLVLTDCAGYIYDTGGPAGNYINNSRSFIRIQPPVQKKIKLVIQDARYETNYDTLFIFDGPSPQSPLLKAITGGLAIKPLKLYSSSNSMLIYEYSDFGLTYFGFSAYYFCVDTILAISEKWEGEAIHLYKHHPFIIVEGKELLPGKAFLYNIHGQALKEVIPSSVTDRVIYTIDMSNMPQQVYILMATDRNYKKIPVKLVW